MDDQHRNTGVGRRLLGLDFGKYLLSSDKRVTMESDNTTGTESDYSDWETNRRYAGNHGMVSENSEDSDEYGIYYGDNQMFDTAIDSGNQLRLGETGTGSVSDRHNNQVSSIINQLNISQADSAYSGSSSLYPIHETGSGQETNSSGSYEENENSDSTISNSGSPVHNPVYGRYQKLPGQPGTVGNLSRSESTESLDLLTLHRLPGENLGMILGIEGGKDGTGKVSSVSVKSVTLGGAAYRATGSSKGLCVGDEIIQVNNTDLRELMHDECISVFKDMPLRVLLGIRRGQKDLPAVSISPCPPPVRNEMLVKKTQQRPVEIVRQREMSDSEEEGFGGFAVYQVTVAKQPEENLGLSIVPSYGSTKEYYQIKRILPSGAASRSGLLRVGDRLIRCNNTNLRALTQNHCLNIIKAASSHGSVNFEVIRPITDGSSMEISVTLNNNNNSFSNFDPQQYSVKSQSYDRNVDVVVTSESEDYLTVSEDEYSRSGRLKNIPEVEANTVFASNSVKLAFQKPFNAAKEGTTAEIKTESDSAQSDNRESDKEGVEIVDLNRINSSPYHVRHKQGDTRTVTNSGSNSAQDHQKRTSDFSVPSSDIDNIGIDINQSLYTNPDYSSDKSTSPRSPLPNTDLDSISVSSPYNKRQQVPSGHQPGVSPPYNYPSRSERADNPVSDIDDIRYNPLYEESSVSGTDSEPIAVYVASPLDSPEHVQSSDLDKANYSNSFSSRTSYDSGRVQPNVHDNENRNYSNRAKVDDINGVLPPPFEFSDSQNESAEDSERGIYLPVTNIDDIASYTESSVELSPVHQQIEIIPSERSPRGQSLNLESSFRELEQVSYVDQNESDSSEIESDSELTAAFDTVLREQENCVHETSVPVEYADVNDNDILQVIQTRSDGKIIISQFDPSDKRETSDSPTFFDKRFVASKADSAMDTNSEAMLKDALDMEYDQLPETCKFESRLRLGANQEVEQIDVDDSDLGRHNVVSQEIAAEMVRNESGGFGYYMESDDEPDQYPDQDMPEDAPDLPDQPPPELMNLLNAAASKSNALNGVDASEENETFAKHDSNWSFGVKTFPDSHSVTEKEKLQNDNVSLPNAKIEENGDLEIVPCSVKRKVAIPIDYLEDISKPKEDNDAIVPTKIKRTFEIPSEFTERKPEQLSVPSEELSLEPVVTVTTKKSPPRVAPKPSSRNNKGTTIPIGEDSSVEPVKEEVIEAKDVRKDNKKNLINVINVVNAMKAGVKDSDPDVVDKIVKEDKKDKLKNCISSVISLTGNKGLEISPPKHEIIVSQKDKIKLNKEVEMSPPKEETIVTEKEEIRMKKKVEKPSPNEEVTVTQKVNIKPSVHNGNESAKKHGAIDTAKPEDKKSMIVQPDVPKESDTHQNVNAILSPGSKPSLNSSSSVMKTTVYVEKPKPESDQEMNLSKSSSAKGDHVTRINPVVPSLDLKSVSSPDSLSPREDTTPSPTTYKTTIGVKSLKPTSDKPSLAPMPHIKPLSQIKPLSFNPKSLSPSTKPVQYKTTIGTSGTKPGGLSSTLGRLSTLTSKKMDHPIKRMETMPFEVSILKGILGIGIKTAMTPEGYVKVTEILPSGPVGREGNIKVGDFILSINNTQLTGLTDAKVQQILRLLPRGLSKVVATAVPPGQDAPAQQAPQEVREVEKVSSKKSSALSSPRQQPTITATPSPTIVTSPRQLASKPTTLPSQPKSLPPQISPRPTQLSPRSPLASPRSPISSPRSSDSITSPRSGDISPRSPSIPAKPQPSPRGIKPSTEPKSPVSPISSPRQQGSVSLSPRTPPPVAPKPRRSLQKADIGAQDTKANESIQKRDPPAENQPIEAEIFASISGPKEDHIPSSPSGPNILPGSLTYDTVQDSNKTDWTQGVVSSSDIKLQNSEESKSGKLDIVPDACSSIDAPSQTVNDTNAQVDVIEEIKASASDAKDFGSAVKEIPDSQDVKGESEMSALNDDKQEKVEAPQDTSPKFNRARSFSASSEASSYTEFSECNVEDDLILEKIITEEEEPETALVQTGGDISEPTVVKNGEDEYESDFEEGDNEEIIQPSSQVEAMLQPNTTSECHAAEPTNDGLKVLAEQIVSGVIETVKQMDLSSQDKEPEVPLSEPPILPDESPPLPESAPPLPGAGPPLLDETSTSQDETSIHQQTRQDPADISDNSTVATMSKPVDDLTLYPDETSEVVESKNLSAKPRESDISDTIVSPNALHATAPTVIVDSPNTNSVMPDAIVSPSIQVTDDSKEQEEDETPQNTCDSTGDQTIHEVIDMYSDIEKSNAPVNIVIQNETEFAAVQPTSPSLVDLTDNKTDDNVVESVDADGSCDTKSLTSSDGLLSDADIVESVNEMSPDLTEVSQNIVDLPKDSSDLPTTEPSPTKVNGHSAHPVENRDTPKSLDLTDPLSKQASIDKEGSLSPRSGSAYSPRAIDALQNEDETKGKYSPDLDRMIRMMSTSDEPEDKGEGHMEEVKITKGVTGVGFIIQGGMGSIKGDLPISIKRVFKGGPAEGVLQVGDEIHIVNGEDLSSMRHSEAWRHLKYLESGDITMLIKRF